MHMYVVANSFNSVERLCNNEEEMQLLSHCVEISSAKIKSYSYQ